VLILTYDEALRMAQSQRSSGKAFPVVFADAPELGGNYTLYIQVDQMPQAAPSVNLFDHGIRPVIRLRNLESHLSHKIIRLVRTVLIVRSRKVSEH